MRTAASLLLGCIALACYPKPPAEPTPVPPPDAWDEQGVLTLGIPCDSPAVIHAGSEEAGIRKERQFLDRHYPGHGPYQQSVVKGPYGPADELSFNTKDGQAVAVCFDIGSFFGKWQ